MFGSHLSIAGSMLNALTCAVELGLDTVQVFTKNQRQWKVSPLDPGLTREWLARVKELGWDRGGPPDGRGVNEAGCGRIVAHASYLPNLASPSDTLWATSVDSMTNELERCEALGIALLVHHPGAFKPGTAEEGIARVAEAYAEILRRTAGFRAVLCLEGTVGAGSQLGGPFEHLAALRAAILERSPHPARVGFCLDSCHMHAAGYDMSTRRLAEGHLAAFHAICGLENLKCLHLNDSKGAAGSHLDRHEHIGLGTVGGPNADHARLMDSGFAALVNHPATRNLPKILETPKDPPEGEPEPATPYDRTNVQRLRSLVDGSGVAFPAETFGGAKGLAKGPAKGPTNKAKAAVAGRSAVPRKKAAASKKGASRKRPL